MSYVGIDTQGARALGQVLQETAGRVDGVLPSVSAALNLADLPSQVPAQLALVQGDITTLATGVTDKAGLAEPVQQVTRRLENPAPGTTMAAARTLDPFAGFVQMPGLLLPSGFGLSSGTFASGPETFAGLPWVLPGITSPSGVPTFGPDLTQATAGSMRPRVTIAVIGNSYTSGEGADLDTYERLNGEIHPAHRSSQAAAIQVIDRLRAQHPDVDFEVRFVAVSGATPDQMYRFTHLATPYEARPQVEAAGAQFNVPASEVLGMADIVILGDGGNPHFTAVANDVLGWGDSATPERHSEHLHRLADGEFRRGQLRLQDEVLSRMNPSGSLIVVGYPRILPDEVPSDWYNPFSPSFAPYTGARLYTNEAQMVNSFTFELNWQLESATDTSRQLWGNRSIAFINPYNAFDGNFIFSATPAAHGADLNLSTGTSRSFHPTPLGYGLLADMYQPYVSQAVQAAIDRQRPPAPEAPQLERRGDLMLPPGVTLAEGSYVDGNLAPAANFLTGGFDAASLTWGVPGFGTATFTEGMPGLEVAPALEVAPDFDAAPALEVAPDFDAANMFSADTTDYLSVDLGFEG